MPTAKEIADKHGLVFSFDDEGTPQVQQRFDSQQNPDEILRAAASLCVKGQLDEGIEMLEKLVDNSDYRLSAFQNLANCYFDKMEFQKGLDYALKALALEYENSFTHRTLCKIYSQKGDVVSAEKHLIIASTIEPNEPEIEILHIDIKGFKNQFHDYHKGMSDKTYGQIYLLDKKMTHSFKEDFTRKFIDADNEDSAFRKDVFNGIFGDIDTSIDTPIIVFEYGWLKSVGYEVKPYMSKEWKGQDLTDKTLLIYSEQGLGDNILRFSLIRKIKEQYNCNIMLVTYNNMKDLAEKCDYIDEVLPMIFDIKHLSKADYTINILRLTQFHDLVYDKPSLPIIETDKFPHSSKANVVVNWVGRRRNPMNKGRVIDLGEFSQVLKDYSKYFNYFGCQPRFEAEDMIEEIKKYDFPVKFAACDELSTLVSYIRSADLVITIDTLHAHVAGAMGKESYVLLPYENRAFWGIGLPKVPYYDSLECLRGESYLEQLRKKLKSKTFHLSARVAYSSG